ncbi:bifunctional aldolase/short-chain dehydrogenase [Kaistia algarum]|uniref:bifunctional aldolase/short-chain dehydrogenase n=1 Tax=Kaistia algarum TaxID=2083279 RepID=UPI000CE7AE33|nr:bifunctional aldolase/short-chain dehydrogenase [Kaistia algarum]MCX5514751.1 bifunctional aldolase/short-chain dehydrogenase [Kaistia algarum]PPE78828.1 bifunctional aldolase/short-chain dehydrogenase [Kaistia algarum]
MKSRWSDSEFQSVVDFYVRSGLNVDLATRVYTTRLLGIDPELVLHGGGNTSVKTVLIDADGSEVPVICVKGSGWDMGTIEPAGLPAVRLAELAALARFDTLSDIEMVRQQRRLLMDPSAPNPSVEAILHALIPARHVDHTHANAIVSLTNQPNGEALIREIFPDSIIVPYVMPGFDLAKACAKALAAAPGASSMILLKHGIFTWSDDARQSYEAMIELVDRAEHRLAKGRQRPFTAAVQPSDLAAPSDIMPILRGRLAQPTAVEGMYKRMVIAFRTSPAILDLCNAVDAADIVSRGNATPEHVIHIKRKGIALPAPQAGKLDVFAAELDRALADYVADYRAYFERNNARVGGDRVMLDPLPRVFYVAGVGIFAAGASAKGAKVAADVVEATVDVITKAEGIDGWDPLPETDLFDIEYWSLEQVKLSKQAEKPLSRQIAVVTGGAGGLGLAIAKALREEGAEVAILDIAADSVAAAAKSIGGLGLCCDVTDAASVDNAIAAVAAAYGGVDILISNAGAAFQGALTSVSDETFHRAFALNFWGHHYMARAAVRVMEAQATGGALVFNVSKQAVNPGPDFGPYGTSKAALMALMRQYAVEHGASGITSNAVNADRIRTGLMTDEMVAERSKARGLTPEAYMRGNLLKREVLTSDVAAAFVHLAKARTSTGAVLTVDGGNVAAMMR